MAPRAFSALPPIYSFKDASPKAISKRTSYLRARLEFHLYPQVIPELFNVRGFGPPFHVTETSTCSWVGRPVSGLCHLTLRPLKTRFRFGCKTEFLILAKQHNSLARSTKSTMSLSLHLFVSIWFQVLFHSPPGVLFTFPSRYYSLSVDQQYLAFGGGPPFFSQSSSCSTILWIYQCELSFHLPDFYRLWCSFPTTSTTLPQSRFDSPYPKLVSYLSLGSSHFARRYFGNRCFFLFLRVLRCFSSPGSPPITYLLSNGFLISLLSEFPHSDIYGY